ncbi:DUF4838 domain-containing protein [Paenibacillus contaminans]|uniref:DUF4838 domain-containing protein n=1 Tax=Paenibacillus contaminans TaxID=450362 RepID=UPI0011BE44BE|nr:DUF4838 domain-containing protein [Paenibacillus contaminans]
MKKSIAILCSFVLVLSVFQSVAFASLEAEAASDIPEFLVGVPESDWVKFEENEFTLYDPAVIVDDAKAANLKAAQLAGNKPDWAIQLQRNVLPQEGKWEIYAKVRIDPGMATEGHAFAIGNVQIDLNSQVESVMDYPSLSNYSDGEYHYVKFPWSYEFDANKTVQYYFFTSSAANLYVDQMILVKQVPEELPDFLDGVPESDWVKFEENEFTLYDPAAVVDDAKAANRKAAQLAGNKPDWAIQLHRAKLPQEGQWKIYAKVRINRGSATAGNAFSYGIYPPLAYTASMKFSAYADEEYHYVEFPWIYEFDPNEAFQYLWFSTASTSIESLYVDQIFAVKYVPEEQLPDFLVGVPKDNWLKIEEDQFVLNSPAAVIVDTKATNHKSVQLAGNIEDQAIQVPRSALPAEGRWKIYGKVRIERGSSQVGDRIVNYGISSSIPQSRQLNLTTSTDEEYHYIQFPWIYEYDANEDYQSLWFSTGGAAINNLYVDRIIAVKDEPIAPAEKPDFLIDVPESDWVSIEETQFQLADPAEVVGDANTWNQNAVKLPGNTNVWAIQLQKSAMPSAGKWKLYANVRIETALSSGTKAFQVGIYPSELLGTPISRAPLADGKYHYVEVPWIYEADPQAEVQYLYFDTDGAFIENLYVDRIIAVKYEENETESVTIVNNGAVNAIIVYPEQAEQQVVKAALTLQNYIEQSTGAKLPVMSRDWALTDPSGVARIYVGFSIDARHRDLLNPMKDDGYLIDTQGTSITIVGPTEWGTEFGVYRFLEQFAGAVWLLPGPDGDDVVKQSTIEVPRGLIQDEPAVIARHFFGTDESYGLHIYAEWARRNGMHDSLSFHHNLSTLFDPKVFSDHPEYYPNGVVPTHPYDWQPCFNDVTASAAINRIVQYFENNPKAISYSLGINDSSNYCEANPNHPDYPNKINSMGYVDMSNIYYAWVNKVAEGVTEYNNGKFADKYFGLLAYWNVIDPPTGFTLHENVVPYITVDRMIWGDNDARAADHALTEAWTAAASKLGFYDYIYGSLYHVPRIYMQTMEDVYRYAINNKVVGHVGELFPNFGGEGPKPWVMAKLQWDPNQDADELMNEWFVRAVGADAAPYMADYFAIWENFWTNRIFETDWYLSWANREVKTNFLLFNDYRYLENVTEEELATARTLMEQAVEKATEGKQKVRAGLMMQSFEYYEASALSFPRTSASVPADEDEAQHYLAFIKNSYAYAKKRVELRESFRGDPILEISDYLNAAKWDGIQFKMINALQQYLQNHPEAADVAEELDSFLIQVGYKDYSATAVKTSASKQDILNSLDFTSGPWTDAQSFSDFLVMSERTAPPVDTRVYLLWDEDYLYVGYENADSEMMSDKVKISNEIVNGWWKSGGDDSVETFIAKDKTSAYKGYMTNPLAMNLIYHTEPQSGPVYQSQLQIESNAAIHDNRWNVVQAIPFDMIGVDPNETDSLLGHFFRNYHGHSVFIGWTGSQPWRVDQFHPVHLKKQEVQDAETPTITTQPQNRTVNTGGSVTLTVYAGVSQGTLSYQWYSSSSNSTDGGTAIDGAIEESYQVPTNNEGVMYYYAIVTNTDDSATGNMTAAAVSSIAKVTVNDLPILTDAETPIITTQPQDRTVNTGGSVTLTVYAGVSQGTLSYQWYSSSSNSTDGGTAIDGAIEESYQVPTNNEGVKYYYAIVTNTDDSATGNMTAAAVSSIAKVTVNAVSGSGNPTTTEPTKPDTSNNEIEILINGKPESLGTTKTVSQNGRTVFTIAVDRNKLENKLASEGQQVKVTIPVRANADAVIAELNGESIKRLEDKQAIVEIQTERATYTLPAQQIDIDAIAAQLGQSVSLGDIRIQIEIAAPTADMIQLVESAANQGLFEVIVPPIDFTVKYTYGDKTYEVTAFNAYVERMIAIPNNVDPDIITTAVVVDKDGTVRHVPTKIVSIDGKNYAKISSLTNSTYTLIKNAIAFRDTANHWAEATVQDIGSRMIINGIGNQLFDPDRDITRAEFVAIVVRGLGIKPENAASAFSDVKSIDWYAGAIHTAVSYGLIDGFEDGTFRPNDSITREQAMMVLARAMSITNLKAKLHSKAPAEMLKIYQDADAVAQWAKISIAECIEAGIVSGRSSTLLAPKEFMTRAEVATIIHKLLQKSEMI